MSAWIAALAELHDRGEDAVLVSVAATKGSAPRGPIAIDPETRDIMQNEYLREVRMVNGQLANVEIETFGTMLKDPWKEFNKKQ